MSNKTPNGLNLDDLTGPIWWPAHPEIYKGEVKVGDIVTIVSNPTDSWGRPFPLEERKGSQTHTRELLDVRVVGLHETGFRYQNPERNRPQLIVERPRPDDGTVRFYIDHTQVLAVKK